MSPPLTLAQVYRFLGQAMRYPEPDWFTDNFLAAHQALLASLDWPEQHRLPTRATSKFQHAVQVEYTRLFINALPHVIAPPYGSIFMDGSLNGPWAEATLQYYYQHGFRLTDREFPDHLVTGLDFLALREEEEEGSGEDFLRKLWRPWFPIFRDKVLENSEEIYLTSTIKLIDFFTREEIPLTIKKTCRPN